MIPRRRKPQEPARPFRSRRRTWHREEVRASQARSAALHGSDRESATFKMAVAAIGIVFGDIGTSPLYAFRETFTGHHHLSVDELHI